MRHFLCFSVQDARKHFPDFDRKRLTEWQKKGYLQKVVREYYIFTDISRETSLGWYAANCVFEPSYISLQSALNYYGFIPEGVFQVTSITTKRTKDLDTPEIRFIYRNIKKSCYFGYTLMPFIEKHHIRLAEPEKALLDLLYLDSSIVNEVDFEAWRFNRDVILKTVDMSLMEQYALLMENRSFYRRFTKFKEWLNA
ncbi:MAG: hypothetical protein K2X86_03600 [Cytophagaceae bacterium]|nr:hypothetical protein [Cytophagaceae bacterium]